MGRGRVYTYRYTVTTRMTCIKMGSDESHFNVSLIVRDKDTRPCLQTTTTPYCPSVACIPSISDTLGNTGVHRHKTKKKYKKYSRPNRVL